MVSSKLWRGHGFSCWSGGGGAGEAVVAVVAAAAAGVVVLIKTVSLQYLENVWTCAEVVVVFLLLLLLLLLIQKLGVMS